MLTDSRPIWDDALNVILSQTPPAGLGYPASGTRASATDIPNVSLEWMVTPAYPNGAWFGHLGTHANQASLDAVPTLYLATSSTAMVAGVSKTFQGQGVGWVAVSPNNQSDKLIGMVSQNLLAGAPLQVTTDTVTASLGPTSQGASASEYDALKSGKNELRFQPSGSLLANTQLLKTRKCAFLQTQYSNGYAQIVEAPWPQSNGTTGWWLRGSMRLIVDGAGSITFAYAKNNTNFCRILVDGKALSGSAADGSLSNAVASTGWVKQWCTLTLTGNKRRIITIESQPAGWYSIIHSWGINVYPLDYVGKALIFGDSFASRVNAIGEGTPVIISNLASTTLELLGYDAVDTATGSTGFLNNGGGGASGKDSYSGYIDRLLIDGVPLGFNPSEYSLIWMYGTGNDIGTITTSAQYLAVINKALAAFPAATIVVTSVYEGFTPVATARAQNDLLYAAVVAAGSRVKWVPVDSFYKPDGVGVFSGSGSVPAPANNGNADAYFSSATQGAGDRHPNMDGVIHAIQFYGAELIRSGIPYKRP